PYAQWELEALPAYPPVAGLELPASITAERVGLNVSIHAQVPVQAVESRTHSISTETLSDKEWNVQLARGRTIDNRDFVLRYGLAGVQTQAGALAHRDERGGFFSALIEPPAVPAESEITPREVVFVLDASGSMSGLPMEASKAFMRAALGGLRATDAFRIIRFSDSATEFSTVPLPATPLNIVRGIRYTNSLHGSGGTMMSSGIRQALDVPVPEGSIRLVVFLTDGYIGNDAEIIGLINQRIGDARLYAFGVGTAVNRYLLSEMGRVGRGFTRYMDPSESVDEVADELASRIASPVLTDIRIDWGALQVSDVYPSRIPDLFAGQSLRIQGRTRSTGEHEIVVHGRVNGRAASMPVRLTLPESSVSNGDAEAIPLVWARSAIAEHMRALSAPDRSQADADALEEQVTQLGLDYSLVTRWTAFVAVSEKIYNTAPESTDTLPVPIARVAGVTAKAYGQARTAAAPVYAGHAAPEPPVILGLALTLGLGLLAFARRRRGRLE
ncbi:MAG: VWA domain-containing protein, partial [Gammaproteobacteria bacterium]